MEKDTYDGQEIYCRMLGHHVPFWYCRNVPGNDSMCPKIRDCWFMKIPVDEYILNFREEEAATKAPPPPKVLSLVELIEQAKARKQKETES
jgi:hypothetical protein